MLFRKYVFFITKDNEGNHIATCSDLDLSSTIHGMTLPEACGAAMCTIHQLCNSFAERGIPLPDATPIEEAKKLIEDALHKEQREERLKNEQNNLVLRDSYYRKNDFQSVFVKMKNPTKVRSRL